MPILSSEVFQILSTTTYLIILFILLIYSAAVTFCNIVLSKENKAINKAYEELAEQYLNYQQDHDMNWRKIKND